MNTYLTLMYTYWLRHALFCYVICNMLLNKLSICLSLNIVETKQTNTRGLCVNARETSLNLVDLSTESVITIRQDNIYLKSARTQVHQERLQPTVIT